MVLLLKRRPEIPNREAFAVYSGEALVGVISQMPGGAGEGWHWSITGFYTHPAERGLGAGFASSLEDAKAQFALTWRAWLAWAGLEEKAP